jgi:hypothetical protein
VSAGRVIFNPRNLREFRLCDPKLQDILVWLADNWVPADMVVGDVHRTAAENAAAEAKTDIHVVGPPYRATDIHVSNLPGDPQKAAEAIGALVNARYVYDPARPTMVVAYTVPHGTGPHVHLQVHANTGLRG